RVPGVRRRPRVREAGALEQAGLELAPAGGGRTASLLGQGGRPLARTTLRRRRTARSVASRVAGLLVRGRGVLPVGAPAPAHGGRMGDGRVPRRLDRPQAALPV